ncbi:MULTISPECIES: hypothetical protein [Methanosarcina]|jgi:polyferredoxin|nr:MULTISPECIES: hypothetical protein [Methanosarcina]AKB41636.1 hypothetical protein MSMAW_2645 [Methanosarcina mazei WWM610]AKB62548.1 hypothetical protein MSMAP_2563 [Methanosarcina mazei SarPi]AKB65886.1 hypothetical protein MSMAS_2690 [Methanosarcina mazei S-6]AKB68972.1 hypothetical protein MSMAL_2429 [Methanosarcina mazei LYC]AKB71617.1 hypothetical protein MSMAC_1727 [Methanosarcina mazei C16]
MTENELNPHNEEKGTDNRSVGIQKPEKDNRTENNDSSFKKLVNSAILIVLLAFVFIALFSFFFNMREAIIALFNPKYQALVQAIFSLLVVIIGIYIIRLLLPNKH